VSCEVRLSRHSRALLNSRERREALYAVAEAMFARFTTSEPIVNEESHHARQK
jgi:hypothetical protein